MRNSPAGETENLYKRVGTSSIIQHTIMKKIQLFVVAAFLVATASAFTNKLSTSPNAVEGFLPGNPCQDIKTCSDDSSHPLCADANSNQLFGLANPQNNRSCTVTVYEP